jgi:hypothetical protein
MDEPFLVADLYDNAYFVATYFLLIIIYQNLICN